MARSANYTIPQDLTLLKFSKETSVIVKCIKNCTRIEHYIICILCLIRVQFLIHFDFEVHLELCRSQIQFLTQYIYILCSIWVQFLIHFDFDLEYVEVNSNFWHSTYTYCVQFGYNFWYILILKFPHVSKIVLECHIYILCSIWVQFLIHFNFEVHSCIKNCT